MEKINVVILCGGMATRLGNLTKDKPKILVECDGKPFIDYLLNNLNWCLSKGFEEDKFRLANFIFATGTQYNSYCISDYINNSEYVYSNFVYTIDGEQRIGTGGGLKRCQMHLYKYADKILVINGDSYVDKQALLDFINESVESELNYLLLGKPQSFENHVYPVIEYDSQGIINNIGYNYDETKVNFYSSAGYYMLNKDVLKLMPKIECSLENDIIPKLIENKKLKSYCIKSFYDIGTPAGLINFEEYCKNKE